MTDAVIDKLRLSFEYWGSGPGTGGISELTIELTAAGPKLTVIPDLTERQFDDAIVVELGQDCGWREIVSAIDDEQAYAFLTDGTEGEFPWPWAMAFEGPRNFASELIALAWAGPPLSNFALGVAAATDDQLIALHIQSGSFLDEPFVNRAVTLDKLTSEIDIPLKEFVDRQSGPTLDLSAIQKEAEKLFRELVGEE